MYTITNYSERSIALTGDTKRIKDQLQNLGGRFNPHLTCGAGWIFSKKKETALQELLKSLNFPQSPKTNKLDTPPQKEYLYKKALQDYTAEHPENAGKDWVSEAPGALKLQEGYLFAKKHEICRLFWFHDEGPGYEDYCRVCRTAESKKEYFYSSNLNKISFSENEIYFVIDEGKIYPGTWSKLSEKWRGKEIFKLSPEELEEIKTFFEWQKVQFKKRLDTYIKRYGVEKLSFDTYWANR